MARPELTSEQFRDLSERVVAWAAGYLESLGARGSFPETSGAETDRLFSAPLPEEGMGASAFDALRDVAEHSRAPGPRFFGYVLGSGEPVAALGDLAASVLNQNVTAWRSAPAAVSLERGVVRSLASAIGCAGFQGSLTGGGSSANLMGLAMAREAADPANERGSRPGSVYASAEAHMSIGKAVALLGLGRENLRVVATDARFRMRADALARTLDDDAAAGRRPIAIVATAGTVSTGAVDPLREIASIAAGRSIWLHVDGAYGALAALAAPGKFDGLDLADSISLDAHKWLYQPLDCGCLLFKDAGRARAAFSHTGDYARALSDDPVEGFAFFEESLELSRRFRALKLWLSLRYHGLAAFREAIRADLAHAERLARIVARTPGLELLAPVELSAVCFRHTGGSDDKERDRRNAAILRRVVERGRVYISNATVRGRFALRACFVNHRSGDADVDAVVEEVVAAAASIDFTP